jgi:hypothetical protein
MPTLPARDARRLMKKASATVRVSKAVGACVVRRTGRNTKVLCEILSREECTWINTELQADGQGHAKFFLGGSCPV